MYFGLPGSANVIWYDIRPSKMCLASWSNYLEDQKGAVSAVLRLIEHCCFSEEIKSKYGEKFSKKCQFNCIKQT
jgi:hypothetical protein